MKVSQFGIVTVRLCPAMLARDRNVSCMNDIGFDTLREDGLTFAEVRPHEYIPILSKPWKTAHFSFQNGT
jgi:hypothetical protein